MHYLSLEALVVHEETSFTIITSAQGLGEESFSIDGMPGLSDDLIIHVFDPVHLDIAFDSGQLVQAQLGLVITTRRGQESVQFRCNC